MNPRFQRIAALLGLAAVLVAGGGHWLLLQSVAWAGMMTRYAAEGSLAEAVQRTFDPAHPCGLCLAIRHGRQEERRSEESLPPPKLDFFHPPASNEARSASPAREVCTPYRSDLHLDVVLPPLLPPPRRG